MQSSFPLRLISRRDTAHEDAFLSRYKALSEHALKLTRGNRDVASDLLQDTFVYFTEAKPALDEIENLDGYLYSVLRHLHFAFLRKGMRDPIGELAAIDYESAELTLRAAPVSNRLFVCDQLARACELAVARKDDSRPHCLLLLRFFHGYFLDELVRVAGNSDNTIRKWLREAQGELRAELLGQPKGRPQKDAWSKQLVLDGRPEEFLRSLRRLLLSSAQSQCPSREEIRAHYSAITPNEIRTDFLSHLTVCGKCLDRVNSTLQIPLLANRHVHDIHDRGRKPKDGDGSGPGGAGDRFDLPSARRRRDAKIHHEPNKLIVRINGDERAVYDLGQESHHFVLKLSAQEEVHLVEVVSEQDVPLLMFVVDDGQTRKPLEWRRVLEMTKGRVLEATLRYGETWPSVEVSYQDPVTVSTEALTMQSVAAAGVARPSALHTPWRQVRSWVIALFDRPVITMNPMFTTAMILAFASIVFFALSWRRSSPISASVLLDRAETAEAGATTRKSPGVIYQKVAIRSPRRTMERTIYRDAEGIRHPRRQKLSSEDEQLKNRLTSAGVNWDAPLSTVDYIDWRQHAGLTRDVVARSGSHLLTLTTRPVTDGLVLKETLTVRDTDFHVVDRTVELRASGTIEIAELNYDVLPWGAVNQDWFEPLSGAATDASRLLPSIAVHVPHVLSALELDEAELEARVALNQLQADTGERIRLGRDTDGIRVKGVVDTDARKQQILSRLSELEHVHASIMSVEELSNRPSSTFPAGDTQPIEVHSVEAQASPLEQYLREKKLPTNLLASISHDLLDGALRIQQAQVNFAELEPHFTGANQLSANLQGQLATLSRAYLDSIETGLEANEKILLSLNFTSETPSAALPGIDPQDGNVDQQIHRYQELCRELITGGTKSMRPAPAIADELLDTGKRIRHDLARMYTTIPKPQE